MNKVEKKIYIIWMFGFLLLGIFGMTFGSMILGIAGVVVWSYLFINIIYREYKKRKRLEKNE